MCGITGAIGWISDEALLAVKRMNEAQRHRGPDGQGSWISEQAQGRGASFSHRRLAIIDLSEAASQPMVDPETGWVLTYNGEVYNYRELRRELEIEGASFSSESDTEVVLKALSVWGERAVEKFHGMFALAAWDPGSRRVFLARDRMGIKPLYYTSRTSGAGAGSPVLLFASELRSLLDSGLVARRIHAQSLETYLWNGFVTGPETILEDVSILPPGCRAWCDPERATIDPKRYWTPPSSKEAAQGEDPHELAAALEQAVAERLVSDVPLGVFLSGGVDSSAVTALAAKSRGDGGVKTFNIAFAEDAFDESRYAEDVARQLGTEHHKIVLSSNGFREGLPEAISSLDQPTFDAVNSYFVSKAVREAGITVALAGTGGDELFGGYTSFEDVPRAQKWARRASFVPVPVLQFLADKLARIKGGRFGQVKPQTRYGKLGSVLATRGNSLDIYQISYSLFRPDFLEELRGQSAGDSPRWGLPPERYRELEASIGREASLRDISRLEMDLFLGDRLLRDTDCTSMAVSLEVRLPLLDHKVIETASRLSESLRYHPLRKKSLLIELGTPGVDPSVFDRPKAGFELPFQLWLKNELKDEVGGLLCDSEACQEIGLDADAVSRLWSAFLQDAPGIYWSRIWAIYILLRWTRQHQVSL